MLIFINFTVADAQLESCIIVPPSDVTTIPQQYLVQMTTSGVPPSRLSSFINCTDGDGITCGQSYYTLIDLNEEKYQLTVPVTWSTNSTSNTDHNYQCRGKFGGRGNDAITLNTVLTASIKGKDDDN